MATTVGTVSAEQTTSGVTATIDANCRGLWIVGLKGSTTTAVHQLATITIGGLSFTFHESQLLTQVHCCGYYLLDISGRSNNVITITGWTMGLAADQYRWRYVNLINPTNALALAAESGTTANANGGTTSFSLAPGAGVTARTLIANNVQSVSGGATGQSGLTSPTTHYQDIAGPSGTSHEKWMNSGTITGTTSVGWTFGAGSNTQRSMIGIAIKDGSALVTQPRGRSWVLGALPEIALPLLGQGLVAARAIPAVA